MKFLNKRDISRSHESKNIERALAPEASNRRHHAERKNRGRFRTGKEPHEGYPAQEGDEWLIDSLYGIASAMKDSVDAIAAKLSKTAELLTAPPSMRSRGKPKLAAVS